MGCSCSCSYENKEETEDPYTVVCNDYEEQEDFAGSGIKRTRAWKGTISKALLKAKREIFWMTRTTEHRYIWMQIRQAVEAEVTSCQALLDIAGVQILGSNIEKCQDFDGNIYNIPVFVINDPVEFTEKVKEPRSLQIVFRTNSGDITLHTMTDVEIYQLKLDANLAQVRLFFCGREMKETQKLHDFPIDDGMVISVFDRAR